MVFDKKRLCMLFLCLMPLLLGGCAATVASPLERAEATPLPGLSMRLHAASASSENVDTVEAVLYFRFLEEPMLASETRTLTIRQDESTELAIVRALLEGPSAGHSDLKRILPDTVEVQEVSVQEGLLFITLSEDLLTGDDIPADWRQQAAWQTEAPLVRRLGIQSIVASVTESFPYTGVQFMVQRTAGDAGSQRLDNAYFLGSEIGLAAPQTRDESLLLTPHSTAQALLAAWHSRNDESLYNYIASASGEDLRPSYQDVSLALDGCATLAAYTVGGGTVSEDGQRCVVTVSLSTLSGDELLPVVHYPLPLIREGGCWKIAYSQLLTLMTR